MSHCPQCGEATPEGARACPFCGTALAAMRAAPSAAGRTMVGVATPLADLVKSPPAAPAPAPAPPPVAASAVRGGRTIVGMPANALSDVGAREPARAPPAAKPAGQLRVGQTIVGLSADALPAGVPVARRDAGPAAPPAAAPFAPQRAQGTLLGVARPGIAPLAPGEEDPASSEPEPEPPPPGYEPARELGATVGPGALPAVLDREPRDRRADRHRHRIIAPPPDGAARAKAARRSEERGSRRALALVFSAGGLALAAVLVAVFWPSPPPLLARARTDAAGHDAVELVCKTCPDGTKLTADGASATTTAGVALIALPAPLSVGQNRFKVVVDRPGNGRDETVNVTVNVAYRIHPDLGTLNAERPAFQILAEVAGNTSVTIDGRKMPISAGHGVDNVDVTDECTGLSGEVKTLSRQIPYVVTPPDGPPEQGVVNVAVGIVPLRLDAPVAIGSIAPHVITDGPSFVLAGSTLKGAEVIAAGRPIPVHPDGTFAQVMNVSSVGATQIEVRARMAGMAPRLTQVRVRRVESLEKAARELATSDPPVRFADLVSNVAASVGKAVALTGEVSETKKQGYETVMLLEVSTASGCTGGASCTVRLVQAGDNAAKRGDTLRVFGHVARPFPIQGRADVPEIEVDFTLKPEGGAKR